MSACEFTRRLFSLIALLAFVSCSAESADPPAVQTHDAGKSAPETSEDGFGGRGGHRNLDTESPRVPYWNLYDAGLEYLAAAQNEDGSWSAGENAAATPSVTGLALLAFVGHGESPRAGEHQKTVEQGAAYLLRIQGPEGCFGPQENSGIAANQAIATLAMCEVYARADDAQYRQNAQRGLDHLFGTRPLETALTFWKMLALRSAKCVELQLPERSVEDSLQWLAKVTDASTGKVTCPGGELGPDTPAGQAAAGVLCRLFLTGEDPRKSPLLKMGLAQAIEEPPAGNDLPDPIAHFFITYACDQCASRTSWERWLGPHRMKPVPQLQIREGPFRGSWAPAGASGRAFGRVGTTALFFLCRAVYFAGGVKLFRGR